MNTYFCSFEQIVFGSYIQQIRILIIGPLKIICRQDIPIKIYKKNITKNSKKLLLSI